MFGRLQTFACGVLALLAILALPAYQSVIAGLIAIAMVLLIAFGFALVPKRNVFYVRTTVIDIDPDGDLVAGHDRVAVGIEVTRLWMLYVPTFVAVGFLVVTWIHGTTWKIDLLEGLTPPLFSTNPALFYVLEILAFVVWILLTAWLNERRVFRDADACSASDVRKSGKGLAYSFVPKAGDYYGGTAPRFSWGSELDTLVFYNVNRPHLNAITAGLLFHRAIVIGRGVTELDEQTVHGRLAEAES